MNTLTRPQPFGTEGNIADHAAETASQAIRSTQSATNAAFDRLTDKVESARDRASPLVDRWSVQAESTLRRSIDALRDTTAQLREHALKVSDATAGRVREDPLKSVLIAAAAGAALMGLFSLLGRDRRNTR